MTTSPPCLSAECRECAAEVVRSYAPIGTLLKDAWPRAVAKTDPATGGHRESYARVQAAGRVLGLTS